MRGCIRGTAWDLLRIKRSRVSVCILRSNVPAAATHPQIRKGAERSPSAAPVYLLNADLFNLLDIGKKISDLMAQKIRFCVRNGG